MTWIVWMVGFGCADRPPERNEPDEEPAPTEDTASEPEPVDARDPDGDGAWTDVDCAPWNAAVGPAAAEDPCNWIDDDCDGLVDEGREAGGFRDHDGDGFGSFGAPFVCVDPSRTETFVPNADDCDENAPGTHPGAPEVCNGLDDDCDGNVDEGAPEALVWHHDRDGDGFGAPGDSLVACTRPSWAHVADASDCDDLEAGVHPGAVEWCNGRDDDCDGAIDAADADDAGPATWYADADGDGYGTSATLVACAPGAGWAEVGGDCDDADAGAWPGAPEVCADGRDTDCDGVSTCALGDADALVHGTDGLPFGSAVVPLGDTDGDGFAEVVIGAGTATCFDAGAALYRFDGPLTGRIDAWDADATYSGEHDQDCIGPVVASGGDLNGDGVQDLIVRGTDHGDPRRVGSQRIDSTWVISGASRGEVSLWDAFAHVPGVEMGAAEGTLGAADLDGDGADDLIVAEPHDVQGGPGTGSTFVFSGPVAGDLASYDARTRIFGESVAIPDRSGAEVQTGDTDGDGVAELLILGSETAWLLSDLPAGNLLRAEAASASLPDATDARIFDADDDGHADVVVWREGAAGWRMHAGPLVGEVAPGQAFAVIVGAGTTVLPWDASAGDADGDGDLELLLHGSEKVAYGDYERVLWLLDGPVSGTVGLTPADVAFRGGGQGVRRFAGDLDGDGADDVIVTDQGWSEPFPGAGAALVISGAGL